MGRLVEAFIRLKPKLDELSSLIDEVNTWWLTREMTEFVYGSFQVLKPLSYRTKDTGVVCTLRDRDVKIRVYVGRWISVKPEYASTREAVHDKEDFYHIIRSHGLEIAEYVRGRIRDDFEELAKLTSELIEYRGRKFSIPVNRSVRNVEPRLDTMMPEVKEIHVREASIETDWSGRVVLTTDDDGRKKTILPKDMQYLYIVEDLIDDLLDLYRKANDYVGKIKEHNRRIMKKMGNIVAPYRIASELRPFWGFWEWCAPRSSG